MDAVLNLPIPIIAVVPVTEFDPKPRFRTAESGHAKPMQRMRNAVDYLYTK